MVGKRARLGDQLLGGRAVGGDDAAQRAYAADVPHQSAGVQIPDRREFRSGSGNAARFRWSASWTPVAENSRTIRDSM